MIEKFGNIKDIIEYSNNGVLSKHIVKGDKMDVTLFSMAAGTEIGEHTSTKQGIVYVTDGKGTFVLEDDEIEMVPGVIIHMKENAVHSLKAEENTSFVLVLGG